MFLVIFEINIKNFHLYKLIIFTLNNSKLNNKFLKFNFNFFYINHRKNEN
jgi:hypothetical protein